MKKITVYTLSDPRDGLVKYVGITSRPKKRLSEHINEDENNLKGAWIKRLKSLSLEPIYEVIDITDTDNFVWVEQYWISQFKSWGFPLKNMTDGGDGSYGVTPWNKGLKGVFNHSEESKQKMSEYRKLNTIGEDNGFYGKKHSDENKKRWSEQRKGSKWNDTQREKLGGKNNPNRKPVYCYDLSGNFIRKYDAAIDAEEDGFNRGMISKVCRGIHKSHKGHIFSFEER